MRPQCELMIMDVLPAVRSILAERLKEKGFKQGEIAELLGITQPAVSQYLKKARGRSIESLKRDKKVMSIIDAEVAHLIEHKGSHAGFCPICRKMLDTEFVKNMCASPGCGCR